MKIKLALKNSFWKIRWSARIYSDQSCMEGLCGFIGSSSKSFSPPTPVTCHKLLPGFPLFDFPVFAKTSLISQLLPYGNTTNVAFLVCLWEFGSQVVFFSIAGSSPQLRSSRFWNHDVQHGGRQFICLMFFWSFPHRLKTSHIQRILSIHEERIEGD